jgi:uncharacterized repeat protein (TIGR03803 family)
MGGTATDGTVYKLDTSGVETVLYTFTGAGIGVGNPESGVMPDSADNLYGSTQGGAHGCGAVYKLNYSGNVTVLHTFTCWTDGGYPGILAGVILDASGNVCGNTSSGGESNAGVVYKVDTAGHETVAVQLQGRNRWKQPFGTSNPRSGGKLLRHHSIRRSIWRGYDLQTRSKRKSDDTLQFHRRGRWSRPLCGRDS